MRPDHAYALHLLSIDALRRGEFNAAVALIGSAIRISSKEPTFHLFLGQALQKRGDLDGALSAYNCALSLEPRLPSATFRRATVLMALHLVPEAEACFKQALEIDAKLGATALNQAQVYRGNGELEFAKRLLLIILQFHPRMHEAYVMLGHVLLMLVLYNEARQVHAQLYFGSARVSVGAKL
jgi:tetratricopeptide (TPR) repeat protein